MESNSSANKKEVSSEKHTEGSSQKITNFFPLLRTEGRAKMCASKSDDSRQKALLKKMKGKESMTLRSKRNDNPSEKFTNSPTSSQAKEKIRSMSVASALKTPLSQVLRKSIEASDKKESSGKSGQGKLSENSGKVASSENKKSLSDNESGRILRQKSSIGEKSVRAKTVRRRTESSVTSGNDNKLKSESTPVPSRSRISRGGTQPETIATEEIKSDSASLNSNNSNKARKYPRKRHFRGSTYGLYLTPARKKKKALKSQAESRDDECSVTSTENNSFLDSEDGNSLVSEDCFTPSEKSLVDEDHGAESQNSSSIFSSEKKFNKAEINSSMESQDVNLSEQTARKEKSEMKIEITADYEENTQNVTDIFPDLEEMQWESNQKIDGSVENTSTSQNSKPPQYDDVSSESFTNALHFSFKKNFEESESNPSKENLTQLEISEKTTMSDFHNDYDSTQKSDEKIELPGATETCLSVNDSISGIFDSKDDSNVDVTDDPNTDMKDDTNLDTKGNSSDNINKDLDVELKDYSNSDVKDVIMKEDSNVDAIDDSDVGSKDDSNAAFSQNRDLSLLTSALSEIKDDSDLGSTSMLSNKDNLNLIFSNVDNSKNDLITSDIIEDKDLNHDSSELPEKNSFNLITPDESRENSNQTSHEAGNKSPAVSPLHVSESEEINNSNSFLVDDFKQDSNSLPYNVINKQDSNSLTFSKENKPISNSVPFADESSKLDSNSNTFPSGNKQDLNFVAFTREENRDSNSLSFKNVKDTSDSTGGNSEKNENISLSLPEDDSKEIPNVHNDKENNSFESNMEVDNMEKQDDEDAESTIATCVKSRQRIKRRFTDDIVDTDLGILSVAAMASVKKIGTKIESTKEVVENFQSVAREAKKNGSAAKIECVFNCKQTPIKSCTCEESIHATKNDDDIEISFCQAVDAIDDKLLGCTNPVVTSRLVRPSVKNAFAMMCETHLWRLKHHHSCPYCGLFCSQGSFIKCTNVNNPQSVHLFHEQCQSKEEGAVPFCFHCGSSSSLKRVHLEMHMTSPPAFFLNQASKVSVPDVSKARISFSESSDFYKKEEDEPVLSFKIEDSGKILSSAGLPDGSSREELEKLLSMLNDDKIKSYNFSPDEFYDTAASGDVLKVLYMLVKGFDPNQKFPSHEGETALHAAAAHGHVTVVHLLIQAGAVNDSLNEKMCSPLMLAVENGHKDVVHYLVKKGAITDFKGENGMSSLHLAAKAGDLDVLKILMSSHDADIDGQDDGGWTPIVWASEHDHLSVVKYLLKRGANPNIRDNEGNIGLHWSAFSGSVEISYLYLDYGCDINAVNELGDTPLHIAARQDSFPCVTLFLSRGADVTIVNKAEKLPAECCIDKNSDTYLSLSLNMLLKKITKKYQHKAEKIMHRDISRGKEQLAIQCVNAVDDDMPPLDFLYVTENCETMPIKIDRTITSLQSCHCEDDCSTASCSCASISYQCWYDKEGLLLPEFNLIDPPMLFECNRACSCWSLNCHNRVLQNGITCRLQLIRTKGKGWGVRTLKDIPKGAFICEYVGELISDSAADKRADDSYLFDLDNRDGETYCLDARYYGNISRFINHLCEPNLVPVKVYVDHQDLNFPRIAFFSSRDIKQYEELGFDYGEKFWAIKYKSFTCECGTPKCKYSKESIHITLANYYRRLKEEQMEEASTQPQLPEIPVL